MTANAPTPLSDATGSTDGGTISEETRRPRQPRPPRRGPKVLLVVALVVVALAIAVGAFALTHSLGAPKPAASAVGSPHSSSTSPGQSTHAPAPDVPLSAFEASAPLQKNVDLFNRTAARVAASGNPVGADFTNALASVGFDKAAMQITADRTTINAVAPAIVFAVKVDGKCLLGQYAPDSHEYDHQVVAPISTGSCLIGDVSAPQ